MFGAVCIFSQLQMVMSDTHTRCASCGCVKPCPRRSVRNRAPNLIGSVFISATLPYLPMGHTTRQADAPFRDTSNAPILGN